MINGLDEFVVLPERALRLVRFVPEFVREGGPSFNAEDPRSLNSLLDNMGSWRLTRYSTGAEDYSGDWVAEIEPTEAHMAGFWQHNGHTLYVRKVTGSTYESHTENDVYLRGLTVSGTSVTSPDLSWEGQLPQRNAPTLTGSWSRSNAGYLSLIHI